MEWRVLDWMAFRDLKDFTITTHHQLIKTGSNTACPTDHVSESQDLVVGCDFLAILHGEKQLAI